MRRLILVPLLIIVAVLAIAGGAFYYFYQGYLYYHTDDAQVSGNIVSVSAPMGGQLTTLSVKLNDTVTAGQVIGTITPVANAAANGTQVKPTPFDITSPINGTILQTPAVQGQSVAAGLTLVQLTNLNTVVVTAFVDESQIGNINVGQEVDIHIDAFSNTNFSGHVQQIVQATASSFALIPSQDNASGNFTKVGQRIPVIIGLDGNGGKDLVPGMSTTVTIHVH